MPSLKAYAARFKASAPKRPTRVLIVDDEEPVRRFVERVLSEAGYVTTVASDGAEAVAMVQNEPLFKEKATLWQDEAFLEKPCSVKGLLQAVSLLASGRLEAR